MGNPTRAREKPASQLPGQMQMWERPQVQERNLRGALTSARCLFPLGLRKDCLKYSDSMRLSRAAKFRDRKQNLTTSVHRLVARGWEKGEEGLLVNVYSFGFARLKSF